MGTDGAGTASGDAGTGGSVSVGGGAGGAGGAAGTCGPSAIACDDFEKYPPGATRIGLFDLQ